MKGIPQGWSILSQSIWILAEPLTWIPTEVWGDCCMPCRAMPLYIADQILEDVLGESTLSQSNILPEEGGVQPESFCARARPLKMVPSIVAVVRAWHFSCRNHRASACFVRGGLISYATESRAGSCNVPYSLGALWNHYATLCLAFIY